MKILKYCMAPILFLVLINWYTGFTFIKLHDIQIVMIIVFTTGILMILGSESVKVKYRFRNSIMIVGILLTCMELFNGLNTLSKENIISSDLPDYVKPILLCLVMYPPLSLVADRYDVAKSSKLANDEREESEDCSWEETLSRREREVLELVRKDMTNGQIADKLFISDLTVKKHVYNIMKKKNVSSRENLM